MNKPCMLRGSILSYLSRVFTRVWFWFSIIIVGYVFIISVEYKWFESPFRDQSSWDVFYAIVPQFLVGFIVSCFFYFLVVFVPERRKRNIIKTNLIGQYQRIKRGILSEVISASRNGGISDLQNDEPTIQKLLTIDGFKDVFLNNYENANEGYYAFLNYIDDDCPELDEIFLNMQILNRHIIFVLQNFSISDQSVFDFFKGLESYLRRFETTGRTGEDRKVLSRFILEIFAGYSFVNPNRDYDIIEKMIKDI